MRAAGCRCQRLLQTRKRPAFVRVSPTRQSCAGRRPRELSHWFCSQNLRLSSGFWNSFRKWLPDDSLLQAGAWTWTKNLELAAWPSSDQRVVIVWSVPKSLNKLCGVWILFKFISVEDGKNEASQVAISKLKPLVGIDPQKLWFHRFRHSKPMMS